MWETLLGIYLFFKVVGIALSIGVILGFIIWACAVIKKGH